ncbi:Bromodomain-domain-containing protein [Glonium stellatum]|uniref:Bromodomain-domain-containing protein n=1 Tax=Glonium stellatum TaxID=574774 RepID=A0A8E2EZR0_9PEZI|nr:Bromodomain-domain-containing protein [Glonium stellatum]
MAVMTSSAFDNAPYEGKAQPVPSSDTMALDSDINGVANKYDALFDEPDSHSIENSTQSIYPESDLLPTLNGNHVSDGAMPYHDAAPAPITDVSSGIAPIAQFLPDSQNDSNSLFDGSEIAVSTSILPAVEAPVSDLRQDKDSIPGATTGAMGTAAPGNDKKAPSRVNSDIMDVSMDLSRVPVSKGSLMDMSEDGKAISGIEHTKDRPAPLLLHNRPTADSPSQIPFTQSPTATDHDMLEAPSSGKVRIREDDDEEDAPSAKRTKTEDEDGLGFKVPEVPSQKDAVISNGNTASGDQLYAQSADQYSNSPMTKAQNKFLLERIRNTKKIKVAFAFREPVDPDALGIPQYREFIKEPMDLGTMEQKLKDDKYASMADFMKDMNQIIENTVRFNGQEHPITQAGLNMRAYFIKGLVKMPKTDIEVPLQQRKMKRPTVATVAKPRRESRTSVVPTKSPTVTATATSPQNAWPLNSDGMPLIRRDSSNANDRPKREIHRPPPKDLPYNSVKPKKKKYQLELKFCESVVTEMMKTKHAKFSYPFLKPVDPVALNIPQYLKIIKKPMDLGTIEKNLKDGNYQTAKDFYNDVVLMFNNCYKFNPETDDVHKMGKMFQQLFDSLWSQKQAWIEEHTPVSEPQSPATADSEEEEEEEEVDDEAAKLMAIQQQIAQLNSEAQALLQQKASKRASPKASTKKSAKNAKPAKSRKNSTLPPPKVAPKAKARSKPAAPLTFSQKQEISDAISTLGDADMRKAVQIIRNGCPHLANVNDDEMEIDMEEIGDDCLRELLKFVRAVKGPKGAADDEFEPQRHVAKSTTTSKPKKNKPMGKKEQEDSIKQIQEQLRNFQANASGSDQSPPPIQHDDSSDDDEDSGSESEEE